ncbi:hypothetical protein [[Pseudomonas] boreopolis]|uniref:hypothetical protein n=1 Tax=Xanthomonas boreopolis TaxID=86183 RepID=UPI003DA110D0
MHMAVQGTLLLRWKKRGIEPQDSPASTFEVAVVRLGNKVSIVGKLDGRPFDMTASTTQGVQIQHVVFRENRTINWAAPIDQVSVEFGDSGKDFLVRFHQTILGTNDGAYQIRAGSVLAYED